MLSEEIKQKLILAAIWAPSADNSQPFQYQWQDESTLSLFIDPERSGKASDNRFVLSDIALGAVIENVVIAAGPFELMANVSYLPNVNDEYHVCNISFDSTTKKTSRTSTCSWFLRFCRGILVVTFRSEYVTRT